MKKYILEFPMKNTYIKVSSNPIHVGSLACQYVDKQFTAFGTICIIREDRTSDVESNDVIAVVMSDKASHPLVLVPQEVPNLANLEETKDE